MNKFTLSLLVALAYTACLKAQKRKWHRNGQRQRPYQLRHSFIA